MPQDKKKIETKELLLWGIPDGVKRKFKAACFRQGVSMKDAVVKFMRDYARGGR